MVAETALQRRTPQFRPGDGAPKWRRNIDFAHLPKWKYAEQAVRRGSRDAKVLVVADSTAAGVGSSNSAIPAYTSWPGFLASLMNSYLIPAAPGLGIPKSLSTAQATDNRWTAATGWAQPTTLQNVGFGGKACAWTGDCGNIGSLTYVDNRTLADTFDVYYMIDAATGGSFTVGATGGSTTSVSTPTGTVAYGLVGKVTVTAASAATSNSVTITTQSAAGKLVRILGVEPYHSSIRRVRIANAGVSGSFANNWTAYDGSNNSNRYNGLSCIRAYAPDLTIFDLGINDAVNNFTPAQYIGFVQTIIGQAQVSGDVLIKTSLPNSVAAVSTLQSLYVPQLAGLNLAMVDYFGRTGGYAAFQAGGWMNADGTHGNDASYWDEAAVLLSVLQQV